MARILGVRTAIDSVLSVLAPMGLAAAADGPALLLDLDPTGPGYPSTRSLADLVADGPTRAELTPGREGMAFLSNGGIGWSDAVVMVERLALSWSSLILRVGVGESGVPWPVVPVIPLLPGFLTVTESRAAVWQASDHGQLAPGPGPVLPPLSRREIRSLLETRSMPRGRWVRAWHRVWELPWP